MRRAHDRSSIREVPPWPHRERRDEPSGLWYRVICFFGGALFGGLVSFALFVLVLLVQFLVEKITWDRHAFDPFWQSPAPHAFWLIPLLWGAASIFWFRPMLAAARGFFEKVMGMFRR